MQAVTSQGGKAVASGLALSDLVKQHLKVKGFVHNHSRTLAAFNAGQGMFFPCCGEYATDCVVPLASPWHQGGTHAMSAHFAIRQAHGDTVLLNITNQESGGSADEKLEFKLLQLVSTELPCAMLVNGPMRGRDAEEGYRPEVLRPIWQRALACYGYERLYLFRGVDRLARWLGDGLPVGGPAMPYRQVFGLYCDREP